MILVDVYVPAVEQTYDFRLEETCCPDMIIGEICEMVAKKEQIFSEREERYLLVDASLQCMLPYEKTLEQSGVTDGHILILV